MALDLSRIDALTREVLEAEARKRGIRGPEFRTRTELVRLILRSQYGDRLSVPRELLAQSAKTVASARGLLGDVVGAALAVLPEPLESLARLRSRWPLPSGRGREVEQTRPGRQVGPVTEPPSPRAEAPRPPAPATPLQPDAPAQAAPEEATSEATTPEPVPPVASAPVPEPLREGAPEGVPEPLREYPARGSERAAAVTGEPADARTDAPAAPMRRSDRPSGAPIGAWSAPPPPPPPRPSSAPATRTFVEEPIRTRSMARLLASQGHRERALAIYEELLSQNSEDLALRDEADALRRGELTHEPRLSSPAPDAHTELPDAGDRLWCEGDPRAGLRLRWQLTEQGQERARAVLGHAGELAIRVVAIKPDATDVVRSEITEHGPVGAHGEWVAPSLLSATRCFAAVGLRDGQRFVAVVHARPNGS